VKHERPFVPRLWKNGLLVSRLPLATYVLTMPVASAAVSASTSDELALAVPAANEIIRLSALLRAMHCCCSFITHLPGRERRRAGDRYMLNVGSVP
jgi:hypothetical protein